MENESDGWGSGDNHEMRPLPEGEQTSRTSIDASLNPGLRDKEESTSVHESKATFLHILNFGCFQTE